MTSMHEPPLLPEVAETPGDAGFWRFFAARSVSILGDRFNELVIPILVLDRTGSAVLAGLAGAANRLPALLLALWIGTLVDRSPKRRLMIVADGGRALALIVLAVSLAVDDLAIPLLIAVAFAVGIGDLFFLTAAGPFLVGLVGRRQLLVANGRVEAADAAATLTGPALGAFILQSLGAAVAIAANAASFVLSGLLLLTIHEPAEESQDIAAKPAMRRADVLMGVCTLWGIPQQRLLQAVLVTLSFQSGGIVLLVVALTRDVLALSAFAIGIVLTGAGLGGLVTSLLVAPRLGNRRWGPVLAALFLVMALAIGALALARDAPTAFLANAALDGAVALAFVVAGATRQSLTSDALLGRVGAASFLLNTAAATAGVLAAGSLINLLGHREALATFGALFALVAVGVFTAPAARARISDLQPIHPPLNDVVR